MISELRPAVEVWREAMDAWLSGNFGVGPNRLKLGYREAAAAVIEADREAVRAEQAAEVAKWRDKYNELGQMALEQVSDLGTKLGRTETELDAAKAGLQSANRELAKFKALAETLAGAVKALMPTHINLRMPHPDDSFIVPLDVNMGELRALDAALRKWEEPRDAS